MKNASFEDIGVTWKYWIAIGIFLLFTGLGIWLVLEGSEKNKITGYLSAGLFSGFTICGILWPILRTRERQGMLIERVRTAELNFDAVLFPASRVKHWIALFGSLLLGAGAIGLFLTTDAIADRTKALVAGVAFLVIFALILKETFGPRQGILLRPDGIVWREMFRASYFLPWEVIRSAAIFGKREQYAHVTPCIGIVVTDCNRVETTKRSLEKMISDYKTVHVHLHLDAESLLVPLTSAMHAIHFYKEHPESRHELGAATPATLTRIEYFKPTTPKN